MPDALVRTKFRRTLTAAVVLLLAAMLLGATVLREQAAQAAQLLQVSVANTESSPVPVDQQGTADVNVTDGNLTVRPPAPVTEGGQTHHLDAGHTAHMGGPITASALVIHFSGEAREIIFFRDDEIAARFPAPGPLVLGLAQPIQFDHMQCGGPSGECTLGWAGTAG